MNEHEQFPSIPTEAMTAFINRFFPRQDVHARQQSYGRCHYVYHREPLTDSLIYRHLLGEITLGSYCLSVDNTAHFIVIDADEKAEWEQLLRVISSLAVPFFLEQSRRGGHLWAF